MIRMSKRKRATVRDQETIMDHDQDEQEQWRVYTFLYKDVTGGGAFAPRHCQ
jgi:hypothetical protein